MIIVDDLQVVDVNMALGLIGGNEKIFTLVVGQFLENNSNLLSEVENDIINNRYDEAILKVHSCKGISKNIGSIQLYEIAKILEEALINRDCNMIEKSLKDFRIIFPQVIEDLIKIKSVGA